MQQSNRYKLNYQVYMCMSVNYLCKIMWILFQRGLLDLVKGRKQVTFGRWGILWIAWGKTADSKAEGIAFEMQNRYVIHTQTTIFPHLNQDLWKKNTYFDYNLKACHFVQHFHSIINAPVWLKKSLFAFERLEEPDSMRAVPKRGGLMKARKKPQMCVGPRPVSGSRQRFFAWRQF